jgi:hypothetical protein
MKRQFYRLAEAPAGLSAWEDGYPLPPGCLHVFSTIYDGYEWVYPWIPIPPENRNFFLILQNSKNMEFSEFCLQSCRMKAVAGKVAETKGYS